jgi:hypothetical protein
MNLARMGDIGGCRCILSNGTNVYRLVELLRNDPELKVKDNIHDYISQPKEDGYRSLHLYIGTNNSKLIIEVQIRNQKHHNWATLVEITDLLYKTKVKEGGESQDFGVFHKYLSVLEGLSFNEKKAVMKLTLKYNYFEKLSDVFIRNSIPVRKQWFEANAKVGQYFLISTDDEGRANLRSFPTFQLAEEMYFAEYKRAKNANIVLTHLAKPSYEDLSVAYSNYILTYHSFLEDYYGIFEELIMQAIVDRKYFYFRKLWEQYNSTVLKQMKGFILQVKELNSMPRSGNKNKLKGREREWANDLIKEYKARQEQARKFGVRLREVIPVSFFWNPIYTRTISRINRRYDKQLAEYNRLISRPR